MAGPSIEEDKSAPSPSSGTTRRSESESLRAAYENLLAGRPHLEKDTGDERDDTLMSPAHAEDPPVTGTETAAEWAGKINPKRTIMELLDRIRVALDRVALSEQGRAILENVRLALRCGSARVHARSPLTRRLSAAAPCCSWRSRRA
jgi:hypothetical protein